MNTLSSRHHYIPKFLINGFSNKDGMIYVYDKKNDRILNKLRSPKSVFFEDNRNTVHIKDDIYSSIIEDVIFQDHDNRSSKVIRSLQYDSIEDNDLLNINNQAIFQFFLINLFWRVPYSDIAFEKLFSDANISSLSINSEIFRNDETYKKFERTGLFLQTLNKMGVNLKSKDYFAKISEFAEDLFIIGDSPTVYEKIPSRFADLADMDFLFAVSSKRICVFTVEEFGSFTTRDIYDYNALVIDQSRLYVCSSSKELLENSIRYYKELKSKDLVSYARFKLFRKDLV